MSTVPRSLDTAVKTAYDDQPFPSDQIFTDPNKRDPFVISVQKLCPSAAEVEVLKHLERLRKRGGLPRKSR